MENFWGQVDLESISAAIVSYMPNVLGAFLLLGVFWSVAIVTRKALAAGLRKSKLPEATRKLLLRCVKYAIVIMASLTVTNQLHAHTEDSDTRPSQHCL